MDVSGKSGAGPEVSMKTGVSQYIDLMCILVNRETLKVRSTGLSTEPEPTCCTHDHRSWLCGKDAGAVRIQLSDAHQI
jgi:hypothetical protein